MPSRLTLVLQTCTVSRSGMSQVSQTPSQIDHYAQKSIRPLTYTYTDFIAEYKAYAVVVRSIMPSVNLAGPSYAYQWRALGYDTQFISDTAGLVKYNTFHRYDLQGCNILSSLDMLMALPQSLTYDFASRVVQANSQGSQTIWNEGGTASCSGVVGISNVFGSALWAVDSAFDMSYRGVANGCYSGSPQALCLFLF